MQSKPVWTELYAADAAEHGGKVKICCLVSSQPGMPCKGGESLIAEQQQDMGFSKGKPGGEHI